MTYIDARLKGVLLEAAERFERLGYTGFASDCVNAVIEAERRDIYCDSCGLVEVQEPGLCNFCDWKEHNGKCVNCGNAVEGLGDMKCPVCQLKEDREITEVIW